MGTNRRTPDTQTINNKSWDPLYEVYIQKMVPKPTQVVPHRYAAEGYAEYKANRRERKAENGGQFKRLRRSGSTSSSSSSDDDDDTAKYVDDECFWDE